MLNFCVSYQMDYYFLEYTKCYCVLLKILIDLFLCILPDINCDIDRNIQPILFRTLYVYIMMFSKHFVILEMRRRHLDRLGEPEWVRWPRGGEREWERWRYLLGERDRCRLVGLWERGPGYLWKKQTQLSYKLQQLAAVY